MADLDLLLVSLADQCLYGFTRDRLCFRASVSTAVNGPGEHNGSGCTPRGLHQVRAKVGAGLPAGAVLRGRRWTGEVWTPQLHEQFPGRDWILTRILWLEGLEPGRNLGGDGRAGAEPAALPGRGRRAGLREIPAGPRNHGEAQADPQEGSQPLHRLYMAPKNGRSHSAIRKEPPESPPLKWRAQGKGPGPAGKAAGPG